MGLAYKARVSANVPWDGPFMAPFVLALSRNLTYYLYLFHVYFVSIFLGGFVSILILGAISSRNNCLSFKKSIEKRTITFVKIILKKVLNHILSAES